MDNKFIFTEESIQSLQAKDTYYEVSDIKESGLFLRVTPRGCKTYFLYKRVNGKPAKVTIGQAPRCKLRDARIAAARYKSEIHDGKNHNDNRKAKRLERSLNDVFEIYSEQHLKIFTNTSPETVNLYNLHVRDKLGNKKLSSITRADIKELQFDVLQAVRKRYLLRGRKVDKKFQEKDIPSNIGHSSVNRMIEAISPIFNFAIDNDFFPGPNPVLRAKKFPKSERERFLSSEELALYFEAVNTLSDKNWRDYFLLLIYIGSRRTRLLKMKWSEINFDQKIWTLSAAKTKNKRINTYYLSSAAMEILEERKRSPKCSVFVFPGNNKDGHLKEPKRQFKAIKTAMGVMDFRIHDLRRTLGSHMAINGASQLHIRDALGHADLRSTQIYARLSANAVRESIEHTVSKFNPNHNLKAAGSNPALATS